MSENINVCTLSKVCRNAFSYV